MKVTASCPEGLESFLEEEILQLGGCKIRSYKRSVSFDCDYATFYRMHFFSRIAFRFYREVAKFSCYDRKTLYEGVQESFDWLNWLPFNKTFNVQVTGRTSILNHTHFSALEVKNAITDLQKSV